MASFMWTVDGKELGGHAVVFFQPTADSNVFMYDKSGSYDIATRSHDALEISAALNGLLRSATKLTVQDTKWIGGN
jgi:hypothetical protein